jgi:hypothetical protein
MATLGPIVRYAKDLEVTFKVFKNFITFKSLPILGYGWTGEQPLVEA